MSRVILGTVGVGILLMVAGAARAQVPPPPPPPPPGGGVYVAGPARDTSLKAGTASIRGRVTAVANNAPLARVEIRITTTDSPATKTATTDANGAYELLNLPAGKFTLAATRPNYVRAVHGQKKLTGQGQPIELADGQALQNVNFSLQRAGVIVGRVMDEFGEPVVDVQVMTMRQQFVAGERRFMPTGGRPVTTNDLGEYRLYGLPPGQYFVSATLRTAMMMGDTDDRSGYSPTYFPGTGNPMEAQRITVAPAQVVSGVNLTLLPVRTSRVSGKALDAEGRPMTGGMVMAMERGGFGMGVRSPAQIRPDGSFTLSGLPPGDYILRTGIPGVEQTVVMPITVNGSDISGVQLVAGRAATVRGRILIDSDVTPPPRASVFNVGAMSEVPMMGGGEGKVNADFTFEISAVPGHNRITARAQDDWRLHAVKLNGLDITDTSLDMPAGGVIDNVTIEMTKRVTDVSGRVLDDNDRALRDVWVVIFPQDPERFSYVGRYLSAARPGVDDRYRVRVPAGDYFIVALDDVEQNEWMDPDFLAPLRDRAARVTLGDGERKTLDLKLAR